MLATLRNRLPTTISVVEADANINDPSFAKLAVEMLLGLIKSTKPRTANTPGNEQ
jgi:hypothetical protein